MEARFSQIQSLFKSYNIVIRHYLEMSQALNYIANENAKGVLVKKEVAIGIIVNIKSKIHIQI